MARKQKINKKRLMRFVVPFFGVLFIFMGATFTFIHNRMLLEQTQMEQIAMSRANKVGDVLTALLYKTQVLSALVVQNDGEVKDFDRIAATIYDDPSIKNLILAPGGIVKYVYPLKGNEGVLNLDFFSDKAGNKEAALAKETGELVLGGPFSLIQGGEALVGRLPVFTSQKEFWGIASVTLNYPQALNGAELNLLAEQGFAFEIWRTNPDTEGRQIIASSNYGYNRNNRYVEYPMNLLNAKWFFRLSPIREWYEFWETWILLIVAPVVGVLSGLLLMHNYDLKCMKKELEDLSLIDPLTGIYNRRGGLKALRELVDRKQPFVLCYMDLNDFKEINDKYGHHIGDLFLQKYTFLIRDGIKFEESMFARVGGDEFILVLQGDAQIESVQKQLYQIIVQLQENRVFVDGKEMPMSFSAGYAIFPADGSDLDELLATADRQMYKAKKKLKAVNKTAAMQGKYR